MAGELIRLRPVVEADLDPLESMFADEEAIGVFNWSGWSDPYRWRRLWTENGLLASTRSVLMVETAAGERAGFVSWQTLDPGSSHERVEIGLSLWPRFRGRGLGTDAQRQLVRYLFSNQPVNRIQASTDAENLAEQRALEKAGFTREGVLRGQAFHRGHWRDQVLYAIVRADLTESH